MELLGRQTGGLDGAAVEEWVADCVRILAEHRTAIDAINVYPVADGDTGTNLLHTMRSGHARLCARRPADAAAALRALADGALAEARGNSGVLLAQVLRGFADAAAAKLTTERTEGEGERFGAVQLPGALERALRLATGAVSAPAPGTVLTVLSAVVDAAEPAELPVLTARIVERGITALRATRTQLGALTAAGVVDAGAHGLMLVLISLHNTVAGTEEFTLPPPGAGFQQPASAGPRKTGERYQYEVMYLLDAARAEGLADALAAIGDSVTVAGDGAGLYTVHVHCDDIGAAIEAGIAAGRPHRISVARFADQAGNQESFAADRAVVTIARGPGVAELFRAEGAAVLTIGAGARPSASDVLAVITGTGAATVTVLSNEPELAEPIKTGAEAARHAGQAVTVIPTMSPVQGLAALAVHDPQARAEDDVVAMAEAAAATRRGALIIAEVEALTWAGRCNPGDVLGMVDGEVVFIRPNVAAAAAELLARMLGNGGELVTVLLGAQASPALAATVDAAMHEQHPEVELAVYHGDQHDAVLVAGVE